MKQLLPLLLLLLLSCCYEERKPSDAERIEALYLQAIMVASEQAYYKGYMAAQRGLSILDPVEGVAVVTNALTQHFVTRK